MANPFDRAQTENPCRFPEAFYHWKILGESASMLFDRPEERGSATSPENVLKTEELEQVYA